MSLDDLQHPDCRACEERKRLSVGQIAEIQALKKKLEDKEPSGWEAERQAVIDCLNLYGDDLVHRALDAAGLLTERQSRQSLEDLAQVRGHLEGYADALALTRTVDHAVLAQSLREDAAILAERLQRG